MKIKFSLRIWASTILFLVGTGIMSAQVQSINAQLLPTLNKASNSSVTTNANNTSSSNTNNTSMVAAQASYPSIKILILHSVSNQKAWQPINNLTSHGFEIKAIIPFQEPGKAAHSINTYYAVVLEAKR
jgi:hypothetical protein